MACPTYEFRCERCNRPGWVGLCSHCEGVAEVFVGTLATDELVWPPAFFCLACRVNRVDGYGMFCLPCQWDSDAEDPRYSGVQ